MYCVFIKYILHKEVCKYFKANWQMWKKLIWTFDYLVSNTQCNTIIKEYKCRLNIFATAEFHEHEYFLILSSVSLHYVSFLRLLW